MGSFRYSFKGALDGTEDEIVYLLTKRQRLQPSQAAVNLCAELAKKGCKCEYRPCATKDQLRDFVHDLFNVAPKAVVMAAALNVKSGSVIEPTHRQRS